MRCREMDFQQIQINEVLMIIFLYYNINTLTKLLIAVDRALAHLLIHKMLKAEHPVS